MAGHGVLLAPIALLCVLLYSGVVGAFFCSYDDFYEVRRAAFEDARDPARIFTTAHFGSQRYRPLNRAANELTYRLGGPRGLPFRGRNVAFHIVNVALLYGLGLALSWPRRIAALGACVFAIHPLVNQTLVGAVVTNAMAYTFVLGACLLCIRAANARPFRPAPLILGLFLGWLGLLTYDPAVVVFPLVALALGLRARLAPGTVDRRCAPTFVVSTLVLGVAYLTLRLLFVPSGFHKAGSSFPTPSQLASDATLYAGALATPIDPVLAHAAFGAPFPSQVHLSRALLGIVAVVLVGIALSLVTAASGWLRKRGERLEGKERAGILFLTLGIGIQLAPILLFGRHPSETYLYLPAAFVSLLIAFLAGRLHAASGPVGRRIVGCAVALLLILFAAATWVRNERVALCAKTAARILASIPCPAASSADRTIRVAAAPGGTMSTRYGFYGFRGTDTIGDGPHADPALAAALQLSCSDPTLRAEVVGPERLRMGCPSAMDGAVGRGYWVDSEGGVMPCAARR